MFVSSNENKNDVSDLEHDSPFKLRRPTEVSNEAIDDIDIPDGWSPNDRSCQYDTPLKDAPSQPYRVTPPPQSPEHRSSLHQAGTPRRSLHVRLCDGTPQVPAAHIPVEVNASWLLFCSLMKAPMTQLGALVFFLGWASLAIATPSAVFYGSAAMMLGGAAVGLSFFKTFNGPDAQSNTTPVHAPLAYRL
ncbi:MAG: hypothetical protein CK424_03700 [Legionella sp.]|nr:MAG: hypothetical protein CK424_03700 [Legionella sp.]